MNSTRTQQSPRLSVERVKVEARNFRQISRLGGGRSLENINWRRASYSSSESSDSESPWRDTPSISSRFPSAAAPPASVSFDILLVEILKAFSAFVSTLQFGYLIPISFVSPTFSSLPSFFRPTSWPWSFLLSFLTERTEAFKELTEGDSRCPKGFLLMF